MSSIKFSENLFLGVSELERFQEFLSDDGYKRALLLNTDSFGLIKQSFIPKLGNIEISDNFYVSRAGTPSDSVLINRGLAIDANAELIVNDDEKYLRIPNDSNWYWIKIKYKNSSLEKGVISIDEYGNVTGIDTEFLKVLRGQPNFPSKIKFTNSNLGNTDEYEVVRVINNNSLILQGDFIAESNLNYEIIGTFTPGAFVENNNKKIFRFDNVEITLVREILNNSAPAYDINYEFYISRVRNNGTTLSVEDKRIQWWKSEAMNLLESIDRDTLNPLIGVENVKYDIITSVKDSNIIELAWAFRFNSWTLDTSSKKISILIGNGGIYKDTSHFRDSDFNGWRLYVKNGNYYNIIDSIKSGTQIIVTLDILIPDDFNSNDLLLITPPYEEIEIKVDKDSSILDTDDINNNSLTTDVLPYPNLLKKFIFPINTDLAKLKVNTLKGEYLYNLTYRYKTLNGYTNWLRFPDDTIGYYNEDSFDQLGNLKNEVSDRTRIPYVGDLIKGFVKVKEHYYSFDTFQQIINTGDLFGVNTTKFSNSEPVINLIVSKSKKYQFFKGDINDTFKLNADIYINLSSFKDEEKTIPCREGNEFIIHINQFIDLNNFKIRLVQDYVNPTNYTLVADLDENDICYIKNNSKRISLENQRLLGLYIKCTFSDKNKWECHYDTETEPKDTVRFLNNIPTSAFDFQGNGVIAPYYGWRIFKEMTDRFAMGSENLTSTRTGGTDQVTLSLENIPEHRHFVSINKGGGFDNQSPDRSIFNNVRSGTNSSNYSLGYGVEEPTIGRTSKAGSGKGFSIIPKYYKLLVITKIV